ncbi:MAG TPA: hypothetical protein VIX90_17975 [Edaphobacter sp.]
MSLYGITSEMLTAALQIISTTTKGIIGLLTPADASGEEEDAGTTGDSPTRSTKPQPSPRTRPARCR